MRHPSLLGNKQPWVLSELRGRHSLAWGELCIPCLVSPLPSQALVARPLTAGIYGSPCVTIGVIGAAPGMWLLVAWLCLSVPHVPVSYGISRLSHAYGCTRVSPRKPGSACGAVV